jgi:ABC-type transport system involved in multi-copper enzyme maturation permease subunit
MAAPGSDRRALALAGAVAGFLCLLWGSCGLTIVFAEQNPFLAVLLFGQVFLVSFLMVRSKRVFLGGLLFLVPFFVVAAVRLGGLAALVPLALLAGLGLWLWRKGGGAPLVGPLFRYDLVRLARRGQVSTLRVGYGLSLLVGLSVVYAERMGRENWQAAFVVESGRLDPNALARLGMEYFHALYLVQTIALVVLTPIYVCAAIPEEKENGTLPLLFTTHLRDHEIVLGKLFARLAHTGGILLTGLPVLFLLLWWGGLDVGVVLAATAATALTLLSVGGVSLLCSVLAPSRSLALAATYTVIAVVAVVMESDQKSLVSPFRFPSAVERRFDEIAVRPFLPATLRPAVLDNVRLVVLANGTWEFASLHGSVAWACIGLALLRMRAMRQTAVRGPRASDAPADPDQGGAARAERYTDWAPIPAPGDRPLLWKEIHFGMPRLALVFRDVALIVLAGLQGLLLLTSPELPSRSTVTSAEYWNLVSSFLRFFLVLNLAGLCVVCAFRAAASVSRERQQRTLDGLLTLPVERRDILRAKWWGSVSVRRWFWYVLAFDLAASALAGQMHPLYALLPVAGVVHVAYFTSLGLWLSVACRSTLRANLWTAAVLLAVTVGPVLALTYGQSLSRDAPPWVGSLLETGVNPIRTWQAFAVTWEESRPPFSPEVEGRTKNVVFGLLGVAGYALAGTALWQLTCWRLRHDLRRGRA